MVLLKVLCVLAVLQCVQHEIAVSGSLDCYIGSGLEGTGCSVDSSCLSSHPPDEELQQCQDLFAQRGTAEMPSYAQECPMDGDRGYMRCDERVSHILGESDLFKIGSVHSDIISLDSRHFTVNVSWDFPDAGAALMLPPSKRLRGYEVRIRQNNTKVGCWCVLNPNVSNVELGMGLNPVFRYSRFTRMVVEVFTLPYDSRWGENHYQTSQFPPRWPPYCTADGVQHSLDSCPPSLVADPLNIRVTSTLNDSMKELAVTWSHPSTSPTPHVYYLYGASDSSNFSVLVNNTQQVTVSGLSPPERFTVWVQGYLPCSGTSSFISGFTTDIGCGLPSLRVLEPEPTSEVTLTTPPGSPPGDPTTPTTPPPPLSHQGSLLIPIILTSLAVLLLAVLTPLSVLLGVILYRYHHKSPPLPIMVPDPGEAWMPAGGYKQLLSQPKPDILVLYSLTTPTSGQEQIERYVVARLKSLKYHVNSCNDHTEKTIMQWVEEQARHAHSVLIVCNKSFHSEWNTNSEHRSHLLNSLEAIINSAVSHGNIRKYATILLKSGSDQYVPDNLYIKGMPKFVVEVGEEDADIEDLLHFLKHNSKFQGQK